MPEPKFLIASFCARELRESAVRVSVVSQSYLIVSRFEKKTENFS